ncbi:unnamed protein product [Pedinophyceae sp. YPF-701]|nr:unnamed protein product [Pedinophyceae sp. YPF-701]
MTTAAAQVPRAKFIEDVNSYMKGKEVDQVLMQMQSQLREYKVMESKVLMEVRRLSTKLPDLQRNLDMVKLLMDKNGEEVKADFQLADHVFAKSSIQDPQGVMLWLGADVMLEYPLAEAKELLEAQVAKCKEQMEEMRAALDVVKDQVTTTEVAIARIYNYDVEARRAAKEKEGEAS